MSVATDYLLANDIPFVSTGYTDNPDDGISRLDLLEWEIETG